MRTPECHPDGEHVALGLCVPCYHRERRARWRAANPRRRHPSTTTAARAERLYAELKAAEPYGPRASWPLVAAKLGVKAKTLEKARERARRRNVA